jgi:hypothetical protein
MDIRQRVLDLIRQEWEGIHERFGVRRLGVFGSCVRGEAREESDVDILVEFDQKTFNNYMDLKFFLEDHLGRRVDLVIAEDLKADLREEVLREVTPLEDALRQILAAREASGDKS